MDHLWEIIIAAGALVCAICSVCCAIWVANRDGKWRDTDEAKALVKRLDASEVRLTKLETKMSELATKGDVNTLRAEFHGLEKVITSEVQAIKQTAQGTDAAIVRVEQFLMGAK